MDNPRETVELLKRMQENLLEVRRLEGLLHDVPLKIAALQTDLEERKQAVIHAEEALKEEKLRHARLEGDLKSQQEQLSNKNTQTLAVKTNEQLWAIQKEIAFIREKMSEIEIKIIESLEALDECESGVKDAKAALASHSEENKRAIAELEKELASTQGQIVGAREKYAAVHSQIPPRYASMLERIGGMKGGMAMAEAVDGVCLACNVRIRPQAYLEVKLGKAIHQCANCSRILYYRGDVENGEEN